MIFKMDKIKIVPKVWGKEEWIVNTADYCGKLLHVKKGYRCSLHYHKNKHETFYVQKGKIFFELDGKSRVINTGDVETIAPKIKHRFTGLTDSIIIEFSTHHEDSDSYRDVESGRINLEELKI